MSYRISGIDVHKKMLAVVVSDVEIESDFQFERRMFGSNPEQLRSLAAWLVEQEAEEVVMESTAQYWKPVWEALEKYWKPFREKREGARRKSGTLHLALAQSNRGRELQPPIPEGQPPHAAPSQSVRQCRSQDQRKSLRDRVSPLGSAPGTQSNHRGHLPSTVSTDLVNPAPGSSLRRTGPRGYQTIEAKAHGENDPATPKPRLSYRSAESSTQPSTSALIFDPARIRFRSLVSRGDAPSRSSHFVNSISFTSCSIRTSATDTFTTFNPCEPPLRPNHCRESPPGPAPPPHTMSQPSLRRCASRLPNLESLRGRIEQA